MYNRIGVIGDKDSILAFKSIGMEVFDADTNESARDLLRKLLKDEFAVIYITEDYAQQNADILKKAKVKAYPIIIPIPTSKGSSGYGLNGVKKDVEKAIGVDILFK